MTENEPEKDHSATTPDEPVGAEIGMGEPNSFEPEEDPDAASEGSTEPE